MKCSADPDRGREPGPPRQPEPGRLFSSFPGSGSHSDPSEDTAPPNLCPEFALAPKSQASSNPPPQSSDPYSVTKIQSNSRKKTLPCCLVSGRKTRKRVPTMSAESISPGKTRLPAGLGSRWESSGTIWGIKLGQASTFLIGASAFVLLRGRHVSQSSMGWMGGCARYGVLLGSHWVHRVAVEALTIRNAAQVCTGDATMPSISFSPRYARLFAEPPYSCSRGIRAQPASAARQSHSVLVL
jgi:hypothetical protein